MHSEGLGQDLAYVLCRDLDRLAAQIRSYRDEASLWWVSGTILNPGGVLALHVVGNLEHYVGSVLGESGYARDRAAEFRARGVPREEILRRISACRETVARVLPALDADALAAPYPGDGPSHLAGASTCRLLLHLTSHMSWHLGQVDYHRRILGEAS